MNNSQNLEESLKLVNIDDASLDRRNKPHAAKNYFDQTDLKRNQLDNTDRRKSTNSCHYNESNLDKYVEDYKAKRFGIKPQQQHHDSRQYHNLHRYYNKQHQKSTDDDGELESSSYSWHEKAPHMDDASGFRQAKKALYESLLGHNHLHHNYHQQYYRSNKSNSTNNKSNSPRNDHIENQINSGAKFNSIMRLDKKARKNQPKSFSSHSMEEHGSKADTSDEPKYRVNRLMSQSMRLLMMLQMDDDESGDHRGMAAALEKATRNKRKSINIDTTNMLILQKHQLNMKVNSAFRYTKMLNDPFRHHPHQPATTTTTTNHNINHHRHSVIHDEPELTFDFPNLRAAGVIKSDDTEKMPPTKNFDNNNNSNDNNHTK